MTPTQTEELIFTLMQSGSIKLQSIVYCDRNSSKPSDPNDSIASLASSRISGSGNSTIKSVEEILTVIEKLQNLCSQVSAVDQVLLLCAIGHLREYCVLLSDITKNTEQFKSPDDPNERQRRDSAASFWVTTYNGQKSQERGVRRFKKMAIAVRTAMMIAKMGGHAFNKTNRTDSITSFTQSEKTAYGMISPNIKSYIKENILHWEFDQFELSDLTNNHGISFLFKEILKSAGLFSQFKINSDLLTKYCLEIEDGYRVHGNPYHNEIHGADVLQTTYYLVSETKITEWLSQLELLSILFAAMIHDLEHTGTNNTFHQQTSSDLAMLYNDKSVLENYHVSRAYQILVEINPFQAMSKAQFRTMREIVVECVLSTDMALHFQQITTLKNSAIDLSLIERQDILNMILHCADISGPSKPWEMHERWTLALMQEFFAQGDQEKLLGLPVSPLCDRETTNIPESQVGFISYITKPAFCALGNSIDAILRDKQEREFLENSTNWANNNIRRRTVHMQPNLTPVEVNNNGSSPVQPWSTPQSQGTFYYKPISRIWEKYFDENLTNWQEKLDELQNSSSK